MADTPLAIAAIRASVCALLRVAPGQQQGQFNLAIVGTAWCVSTRGIFVTAHHVLNNGAAREASHGFLLLRAPDNGHILQYWKVTRFILEDTRRDLALLEAPVPPNAGYVVPPIPIAIAPPPDGTPVLTYGCPAPVVAAASVTDQGDLTGIQTILFTHADTGIVSAQYPAAPLPDTLFEFSVAWHHGESGGPVVQLEPTVAAFAIMQHYRNIQGPNGTMAGPRRGMALAAIRTELANAGATLV